MMPSPEHRKHEIDIKFRKSRHDETRKTNQRMYVVAWGKPHHAGVTSKGRLGQAPGGKGGGAASHSATPAVAPSVGEDEPQTILNLSVALEFEYVDGKVKLKEGTEVFFVYNQAAKEQMSVSKSHAQKMFNNTLASPAHAGMLSELVKDNGEPVVRKLEVPNSVNGVVGVAAIPKEVVVPAKKLPGFVPKNHKQQPPGGMGMGAGAGAGARKQPISFAGAPKHASPPEHAPLPAPGGARGAGHNGTPVSPSVFAADFGVQRMKLYMDQLSSWKDWCNKTLVIDKVAKAHTHTAVEFIAATAGAGSGAHSSDELLLGARFTDLFFDSSKPPHPTCVDIHGVVMGYAHARLREDGCAPDGDGSDAFHLVLDSPLFPNPFPFSPPVHRGDNGAPAGGAGRLRAAGSPPFKIPEYAYSKERVEAQDVAILDGKARNKPAPKANTKPKPPAKAPAKKKQRVGDVATPFSTPSLSPERPSNDSDVRDMISGLLGQMEVMKGEVSGMKGKMDTYIRAMRDMHTTLGCIVDASHSV